MQAYKGYLDIRSLETQRINIHDTYDAKKNVGVQEKFHLFP